MISPDDLLTYVGGNAADLNFIETCLDQAIELVDAYVATTDVPESIMDNAYIQVGSELYNRRNAPSGIAQFSSFDGSPVRVARDPLTSVYSILNRYVVMGV